jgi:hypothetical protein
MDVDLDRTPQQDPRSVVSSTTLITGTDKHIPYEPSQEHEQDSLMETFHAMKQREDFYKVGDYLRSSSSSSSISSSSIRSSSSSSSPPPSSPISSLAVDADCRTKMIQWGFTIVDHCDLHRETVAVAAKILDRFLDVSPWALQHRTTFQLASVTCLWTSIKIHESTAIAASTMANLGRNLFTTRQIEEMERHVFRANGWLLHPPTAHSFGRVLASWAVAQQQQHQQQQHRHHQQQQQQQQPILNHHHTETLMELINVQLDAAVLDYELSVSVPPSMIALCAVQNAIEGMTPSSSSSSSAVSAASIMFHRLCDAAGFDVVNDQSTTTTVNAVMERLHVGLVETCTNRIPLPTTTCHHQRRFKHHHTTSSTLPPQNQQQGQQQIRHSSSPTTMKEGSGSTSCGPQSPFSSSPSSSSPKSVVPAMASSSSKTTTATAVVATATS